MLGPWWLVRHGKIQEARFALTKLASANVDVEPILAMVIQTNQCENEMQAGITYRDIFKKVNLRRTEISVGVYTVQVLSGLYLIGYATYFFQRVWPRAYRLLAYL